MTPEELAVGIYSNALTNNSIGTGVHDMDYPIRPTHRIPLALRVRYWLIEWLVGQRPVVMNMVLRPGLMQNRYATADQSGVVVGNRVIAPHGETLLHINCREGHDG